MGLSYRKSFKAGPVRITASKAGVSYSAGVKGARITKRADGRAQAAVSVPGTGLRYTTTSTGTGHAGRRNGNGQQAAVKSVPLPGRRSSVLPYPPPPGTPPLVFKGYLASVTLLPDRIQIDRTLLGRVNGNHSASISWPQLAGIDFLDPTRLVNGHVHFATADDPRGLTATGGGHRMAAAARNPHAIMFTWQQRAAYERLRSLLMANQAAPVSPAPIPAAGDGTPATPLSPRLSAARPEGMPAMSGPVPAAAAAWLPGNVEVQVVGETFNTSAIREAERSGQPGVPRVAVLAPEPGKPHDRNAVAVHVNGFLSGHLPREIAAAAQPSLIAFTASSGRAVTCPARISWQQIDGQPVAQIVLTLDPTPLGLPPEAFDHVPDINRVIQQHLRRLDTTAPALTGYDSAARALLVAAEAQWSQADASYGGGATRWTQAEHAFRQAIAQLESARDPLLTQAWAGLARSVRYQKGRRDDWITAAVTSLYWDRSNTTAWAELVDLSSAAPHVPTLLGLFRRVPAAARPPVLTQLISLSRGHDRLGNMSPAEGERLRAALVGIAEIEGDTPTIRKLSSDASKHQSSSR